MHDKKFRRETGQGKDTEMYFNILNQILPGHPREDKGSIKRFKNHEYRTARDMTMKIAKFSETHKDFALLMPLLWHSGLNCCLGC